MLGQFSLLLTHTFVTYPCGGTFHVSCRTGQLAIADSVLACAEGAEPDQGPVCLPGGRSTRTRSRAHTGQVPLPGRGVSWLMRDLYSPSHV